MSVIVLLIVAGGLVAGGFLLAFVWAVRSGQFDDTYTPAVRVLLENHPAGARMRRDGERRTERAAKPPTDSEGN